MPHKSKKSAEQAAKKAGISKSNVTKSDKGYFIAPAGVKSSAAKKAYASNRAKGKSKEYSAKVAWTIEKSQKKKGK